MGARFRLRANFDVSRYHADTQVVLNAMKHYGLMLADNGSNWYFQGAADNSWDDTMIGELKTIPASAFDAVDESSLMVDPNSGQARQPAGSSAAPNGSRGRAGTTSGGPGAAGDPVGPSPSATADETALERHQQALSEPLPAATGGPGGALAAAGQGKALPWPLLAAAAGLGLLAAGIAAWMLHGRLRLG